jgi:hypothetical protein
MTRAWFTPGQTNAQADYAYAGTMISRLMRLLELNLGRGAVNYPLITNFKVFGHYLVGRLKRPARSHLVMHDYARPGRAGISG